MISFQTSIQLFFLVPNLYVADFICDHRALHYGLRYEQVFIDKIDNIRVEMPLLEANLPSYSYRSMDSIIPMCPTSLYHFDPVTHTELLKIISCMNKITCSSDPFPTSLLMSHLYAIVPILQHIVNLCSTTGDFPISCKSSIVIHLIKKPGLDREM